MWLTNFSDTDSDGMSDDWEAKFNLHGAGLDTDQDCLYNHPYGSTTTTEYTAGSDPNNWDTDGDQYSDGEEVKAGTNPLDASDAPTAQPAPRLVLSDDFLVFRVGITGGNPEGQLISVTNAGGGSLNLTLTPQASWLRATLVQGDIRVWVNRTGLAHRHYTGFLKVAGPAGTCMVNGPFYIQVDLGVFEGDLIPLPHFYIPLIKK